MAQVLKRITKSRSLGFGVTVAMDSVVSVEDVSAEIINGGMPTPLVLMIPLRLGLNCVNEIYVNPLKIFLASKYCVGIMGGKPNQVKKKKLGRRGHFVFRRTFSWGTKRRRKTHGYCILIRTRRNSRPFRSIIICLSRSLTSRCTRTNFVGLKLE